MSKFEISKFEISKFKILKFEILKFEISKIKLDLDYIIRVCVELSVLAVQEL